MYVVAEETSVERTFKSLAQARAYARYLARKYQRAVTVAVATPVTIAGKY